MRDEMPQKLPRYVFRRANGSYRYKRNVPVGLQKLLGKDTIYRQLGNSYKEAMGNLPLVHGRIEALFDQEGEKSAKQRSLEIIRGALGEEVAELVLANAVPEYSEIEDDLNDLGWKLKKRGMPQAVVEQVYNGRLKKDEVTLDTGLVSLLLKHGADANATDALNQTPLHIAIMGGLHECVRLLCEAGADLSLSCKTFGKNNTALHQATILRDVRRQAVSSAASSSCSSVFFPLSCLSLLSLPSNNHVLFHCGHVLLPRTRPKL